LTGSALNGRRRRDVLAALAGVAACSPLHAAQYADPMIGYLYVGTIGPNSITLEAFLKGLGDLGYVQGRNVRIEFREAHNDLRRLPELAQDLVRRGVNVITAPGSGPAALAAKAATATIPIVFNNAGDPIRSGLVASLSRPGGNVTGITDFGHALSAKRLELIKILVPAASRVAILLTRGYSLADAEIAKAREAASVLALETSVSVVGNREEIDAAFAAFARERMDGVCLIANQLFVSQRERIIELADRHRLPAVYPFIQFPESGGLMSYGTSLWQRNYEAGVYTGRILNGANPADLPVRRLSTFELVINMSAARALGLTVPARFLALTDRVIG
jgi:putative tryptophan/tyrosine transport system substrate-binding protein